MMYSSTGYNTENNDVKDRLALEEKKNARQQSADGVELSLLFTWACHVVVCRFLPDFDNDPQVC